MTSLSLFFFLSNMLVHLTSPSGLVDFRGVLMYFWWLFSWCYLKKFGFIIETKQETKSFWKKKDHLALELIEEFCKLDNRMLMNVTLGYVTEMYFRIWWNFCRNSIFTICDISNTLFNLFFRNEHKWKYEGDRKQCRWLSLHRIKFWRVVWVTTKAVSAQQSTILEEEICSSLKATSKNTMILSLLNWKIWTYLVSSR